jgi:hypothetical protein
MIDDESKPPPTLDYASPKPPEEPNRWVEHYLSLCCLSVVTGLFATLMLILGISCLVVTFTMNPKDIDRQEQIKGFIDLPLGIISAVVCFVAARKLRRP